MRRYFIGLVAAIALSLPAGALDVAGVWLTEAGTAKVEIADCGDGTPCGNIIWFDDTDAEGDTDLNNPDPELRTRPILGLPLLYGFEYKRNEWRSGNIYDPETGRTYGSRLKLNEDKSLRVKGCVGPICQTQTWMPAAP